MSRNITLAALRLKQADDALAIAIAETEYGEALDRLRAARIRLNGVREHVVMTHRVEPVIDEAA